MGDWWSYRVAFIHHVV